MSKAHSQKKTKNFHITSITLETYSDCKSDNDSFQLCERCNNGFSKAYYEELKNKTSKFPFTYSSKKKLSKKKITNLENIKLKFIEDENQSNRMKKKKEIYME